jgi:hypothetical protein
MDAAMARENFMLIDLGLLVGMCFDCVVIGLLSDCVMMGKR